MKKIIVFAVALLICSLGWAQTVMTVETRRVVMAGERFNIVFTVNAQASVSEFTPPSFDGIHVLAGPTRSSSTNVNIVNGRSTTTASTGFTYLVEANQEGLFTIGGGKVIVDGKTIVSDPFTVEVLIGDAQSTRETQNQEVRSTGEVSEQDLFMRLELNKSNVVKGEPITATLRLYSKVAIERFEDVRFPTFNGFWSQEIETPRDINFVEENVRGQIYRVAVLRRYVLLPQQTGLLKIDPAELVCLVQVRGNSQRQSMFDIFFDNYQTIRKRVSTTAVTINVQPLPSGAPTSFTGAVGTYTLSVAAEKDSINAHDAVTIIVRVSGEGNVNMIEAPKLVFPPDFEVYDTRTTDNSRSRGSSISGTKQFEFPVIPRSSGTFTIDPVEFTYWDIAKKSYVTLSSKPLILKVGRGVGSTSAVGYDSGVGQVAIRTLGHDIRYIDTAKPKLVSLGRLFMGSYRFWGYVAVAIVLFAIAYQLLLKRRERKKDLVSVRSRKANKLAKLRLKRAGELLNKDDYAGFYEEAFRALWGYVGDKLGVPPADQTKDRICLLLAERKAPQELISSFLALIESCEFSRYAPAPEAGEMDKVYGNALTLISQLEQTIK
ncbi:MAG: BatD family protein [Prevotellaceae bacterium]|jgi:heme exporter protein D|nr:BatD family protein [Prevotellaceae bacterium]